MKLWVDYEDGECGVIGTQKVAFKTVNDKNVTKLLTKLSIFQNSSTKNS